MLIYSEPVVPECYATAQKVKTLEVKQAYLELTQGWRALADEIERLDRNRPKHLRDWAPR